MAGRAGATDGTTGLNRFGPFLEKDLSQPVAAVLLLSFYSGKRWNERRACLRQFGFRVYIPVGLEFDPGRCAHVYNERVNAPVSSSSFAGWLANGSSW